MNRRDFLKAGGIATAGFLLSEKSPVSLLAADKATDVSAGKAKVFFTRDIGANGLKKTCKAIKRNLSGRIAVKVHTGEPNAPYIIRRDMVRDLLAEIPDAAIVETNVFYGGPRQTTESHRKVLEGNGWTFAPVDILDEDGDIELPVPGGRWFRTVAMGKNIAGYDSMLVLTHFKGHTLGGFGGSLKNIGVGCASGKAGKKQLHQIGDNMWGVSGKRFMERMVESGKAVTTHFGPRMAFINVMNNMSVDCDCAGAGAAPPAVPDIGILGSTDLLAVDQASVDLVYSLPEEQRHPLVERIESRQGLRQLECMAELGMGSRRYELVEL
jgi:uncharacterized Fe-S center protein